MAANKRLNELTTAAALAAGNLTIIGQGTNAFKVALSVLKTFINPVPFTAAEQTKLSGIETAATADQSDAEIKTAYEANTDTNAFDDAAQTKLAGIETAATADQTDAEVETAYNAQVGIVSQGDAEAGTATVAERWTPQRVRQATSALVKTGAYTGDGETSQGITGIGFPPKYVRIWDRAGTTDGTSVVWHETANNSVTINAAGFSVKSDSNGVMTWETNQIISLDADGFTVDDNGADEDPNKNTRIYQYLAIG